MRVTIKADTAQMQRKLQTLVDKQLTFAAAVAATKTAIQVRNDYVLRDYRRTFDVKNKAFEKVVHNVAAADARFAKSNKIAIAAIKRKDAPQIRGTTRRAEKAGKAPANTRFMNRHVNGGIKFPQTKKTIAIPLSDGPVTRRRSGAKAGAVTKTFEPKTVMGSDRGFILNSKKKGKKFIARRMARGKVQVLYTLDYNAKIRKRYNPLPEARRGVMLHYPRLFRRAFVKALVDSKRRGI